MLSLTRKSSTELIRLARLALAKETNRDYLIYFYYFIFLHFSRFLPQQCFSDENVGSAERVFLNSQASRGWHD
jgi:hypothetical protein